MDQQNLSAPESALINPVRRLVAAGFIRRLPGRTFTVRATQAGVTGTITPAAPACCGRRMDTRDGQLVCSRCGAWIDPHTTRVAALHRLAREDYESSAARRTQNHRDDAHLIASASEAVAAR